VLTAVGMLGLAAESGARPHLAQAAYLRAIFGLLLLAAVAARHIWRSKTLARAPYPVQHDFSRRTARLIYLLLYLLVGFELLLDINSTSRPHTERCQAYIAYGIAALLLIRAISVVVARGRPAKRSKPASQTELRAYVLPPIRR
jgi:hypothetical protein